MTNQMIGDDPKLRGVIDAASRVASTDVTVLLQGESGTGKELIARAIHAAGQRAAHPFVAVNGASLSPTLLESELFGHVSGAFTGTNGDKMGKFKQADGGTIFLDEIGETTPAMQIKLLRVLQERRIRRVGGTGEIDVDVRVITATNQNLEDMVREKRFREDLYYRLHVLPIYLPPLRDRTEDITLLVNHFIFANKIWQGE